MYLYISWGWVHFQLIFIFGETIPLSSVSLFVHVCMRIIEKESVATQLVTSHWHFCLQVRDSVATLQSNPSRMLYPIKHTEETQWQIQGIFTIWTSILIKVHWNKISDSRDFCFICFNDYINAVLWNHMSLNIRSKAFRFYIQTGNTYTDILCLDQQGFT